MLDTLIDFYISLTPFALVLALAGGLNALMERWPPLARWLDKQAERWMR